MSTPEHQLHYNEVDEALARLSPQIEPMVDLVLDQNVSDYPILVWQRGTAIEIGVLLKENVRPGLWEVRMSTLEELVSKGLMRSERVADFRQVFNNARQQYCLFVVTPEEASFVFRPRG